MQAPTSKRQGFHKNHIALSKFHRRGEHCSPAKALCCRKAPRVEQSPTPTMHRERVRLNFIAISQFRRRGGAPLRPPLPHPQTRKYAPASLAGLPCRPLQAKGKACVKNIAISKFHRRGEHRSPGFAAGWPLRFARLPSHRSRAALLIWQCSQRHTLRCDLA